MLISNSAGYKVFCEINLVEVLPDHYHVRVYSTDEHAKEPGKQQPKFDMIMSLADLEQFRQSLTV